MIVRNAILLALVQASTFGFQSLKPCAYSTRKTDEFGPQRKLNGTHYCVRDRNYTGVVSTGKLTDGVFGEDGLVYGAGCDQNPWAGWRVKDRRPQLTISFSFCEKFQIDTIIVNTWVVSDLRARPLDSVNVTVFCEDSISHLSHDFQPAQVAANTYNRVENRTLRLESNNSIVCLSTGSVNLTLTSSHAFLLLGEIEFQGVFIENNNNSDNSDNSTSDSSTPDIPSSSNDSDNIGIAVGVGLSISVILIALVLVIIIIVWKRHHSSNEKPKPSKINGSRNPLSDHGKQTGNGGSGSHGETLTNPSYNSLSRITGGTYHQQPELVQPVPNTGSETGPVGNYYLVGEGCQPKPLTKARSYDDVCDDNHGKQYPLAKAASYDDILPDNVAEQQKRSASYTNVQDDGPHTSQLHKPDSYEDVLPSDPHHDNPVKKTSSYEDISPHNSKPKKPLPLPKLESQFGQSAAHHGNYEFLYENSKDQNSKHTSDV